MSDNKKLDNSKREKGFTGGTIVYEAHGNLYLNITNMCTAKCSFCLRDICDGVYGYSLWLSAEPTYDDIIDELEHTDLTKYKEIVFTGFGEPTCRLDTLLRVTKWLYEKGKRVRLDTNGHAKLMYPGRDVVTELKEAGMESISISLNAESAEKYNQLCIPEFSNSYASLLEFTKESVKAGMRIQMTVVGMPEIDIEECEKIATCLGATFRVR
ncbi:MAG: TatD family nuclease-associated radical SAM protein [Methanolobus sp.]|uniref:TatD family nuclease-associated radical SAM protein n=1 Tax=Methanolobus sp. TaxID=1874737 RepID=UPI00273039C2|nr:TatD family nuclease-associated radical SAM protein [Methanolobus sp.]MDP2216112.1 TatD family nuclease-associated radical SAM protein [Methanolobus sp.]